MENKTEANDKEDVDPVDMAKLALCDTENAIESILWELERKLSNAAYSNKDRQLKDVSSIG